MPKIEAIVLFISSFAQEIAIVMRRSLLTAGVKEQTGRMCASVLEELRVFKRVAQKIRSTLVSGREEMVSPTLISRSFLDSFEKMAPATSLVRMNPHN